jgi:predicted protein tyrosine phosphatase
MSTPEMIVVSSLSNLNSVALQYSPSHVLTLLSPDRVEHRSQPDVPLDRHLKLYFHDITTASPGLIEPSSEMIKAILDLGKSWTDARPMLIHCWAGISRSSAAAFLIACQRNDGCEHDIAGELRRRAPFVTPNRLMVALADDLLERRGRMVEAVDRIGRGVDAFEGTPYELSMDWRNRTGAHPSGSELSRAT